MAVDFSLLPVELPMPETVPSRLVWTIVFFVLTLAGVFAVLLLWPKALPSGTWQFWSTIFMLPAAFSALVVLKRFSVFEGQRLDVAEYNEAVQAFNQKVFLAASRPLALVAATFRFSADCMEEGIAGIQSRALKLGVLETPHDGDTVKARWFVAPDVRLEPGDKGSDHERQRKVVARLFTELLDEIAGAIQILPVSVPVSVHFAMSSELTVDERNTLWSKACKQHKLCEFIDEPTELPTDLSALDAWMDALISTPAQQARLIVAIQLNLLLSQTPPEGSAEAAVAVLLMPDALAKQHKIAHHAELYRPVRSKLSDAYDAMMPALKWADAKGSDIGARWQTGLNDTMLANLVSPGTALALDVKPLNLDESVGFAGVAAPWLALACAIASLSESCSLQMVLSSTDEFIDCAVLRRASADPAFAPRSGVV